jgi:PAS domain-containing protein
MGGRSQDFGGKFQKVFRSSSIPFSITTVNEGRFVDVKAAFERRYGYSRGEVLGPSCPRTQDLGRSLRSRAHDHTKRWEPHLQDGRALID